MKSMEEAVASLNEFLNNENLLEPNNWNRTNFCGEYRRRPDYKEESEYEEY